METTRRRFASASEQVVLRAAAVLGDPLEVLEVRVADDDLDRRQPLLGEQAGLDALGELDLLDRVQQRDLADLLQVILDRVRGRARGDDLLLRLVGVVGVREREALLLGDELLLQRGLLGLVELGVVDLVEQTLLLVDGAGLPADGQHDVVALARELDLDLAAGDVLNGGLNLRGGLRARPRRGLGGRGRLARAGGCGGLGAVGGGRGGAGRGPLLGGGGVGGGCGRGRPTAARSLAGRFGVLGHSVPLQAYWFLRVRRPAIVKGDAASIVTRDSPVLKRQHIRVFPYLGMGKRERHSYFWMISSLASASSGTRAPRSALN